MSSITAQPRAPQLARSVFMISIDTEMAWGFMHYGDRLAERYKYRRERELVAGLLDLFAKHDVRATWAVVGHLFLDRCRTEGGRKHPELVRPQYPWLEGRDWLGPAPCSDVTGSSDQTQAHPMWYGRDIVEMIKSCKARQEVGSHTFSHIRCADPAMTAEALDSDLNACRRAAEGVVPAMRSFVYPRHERGHLEVVVRHGFTSYRDVLRNSGQGQAAADSAPSGAKSARRKLAVYPEWRSEGIWNFPATYFFDTGTGRVGKLPSPLGIWAISKRVDEAVRSRGLFHLWFHPHNLTERPEKSLAIMDRVLKKFRRLNEAGLMDNLTMGELAERLGRPASPAGV